MVTISDVAKAAGVSVATVSRVMNHSDLVAESTAAAVWEAIRTLSYVPNEQARNLRRNESRTVLVLLPNITNPYYANVYSGINERAQELGYSLFLCNTERGEPRQMLGSAIEQKRVDGAILLAIDREDTWIQKYSDRFPIVQCCEYAEKCDTPHVSIDNYRAGYEATAYLVRQGCRRIGTISSTNHFASTYLRMKGYRDALADAGLPVEKRFIGYSDMKYSYSSSLHAAKKLLTGDELPDALFCIGDSLALGAVVVAMELGIPVPGDLSIIGFDDVMYTTMIHPYLTTIVQPCASLGRMAMDMLHKEITEGSLTNRSVVLPHGFVARESTKTPG